jgi:hypothetical protein
LARDLGGVETAQGSQCERHLRLHGQRRVAACEDQSKTVVGDRGRFHGFLGQSSECLELGKSPSLIGKPSLPAEAVDGPVPSGHRDPGPGFVRDTLVGPSLQGNGEGFLDGLLGQVEVAQHSDERGDRPPRLLAEQAVDDASRLR